MQSEVNYRNYLPVDGFAGTLIGRAWVPGALTGTVAGPSPVILTDEGVFDLSGIVSAALRPPVQNCWPMDFPAKDLILAISISWEVMMRSWRTQWHPIVRPECYISFRRSICNPSKPAG